MIFGVVRLSILSRKSILRGARLLTSGAISLLLCSQGDLVQKSDKQRLCRCVCVHVYMYVSVCACMRACVCVCLSLCVSGRVFEHVCIHLYETVYIDISHCSAKN